MTGKPSVAGTRADLGEARLEPAGTTNGRGQVHHPGGHGDALVRPDGSAAAGFAIVSWTDVLPDEHRRIRESHERAAWIRPGLEPWVHDAHGFEPVSSVGLRYRGEVVGWVINHRMDERTVRFTCSFMRGDLSRRARILPLYSEAIRRLAGVRCELCTMVTPTRYPEMIAFIRRHCQPYVHFTGETRGTSKALAPSPDAAAWPRPFVA